MKTGYVLVSVFITIGILALVAVVYLSKRDNNDGLEASLFSQRPQSQTPKIDLKQIAMLAGGGI